MNLYIRKRQGIWINFIHDIAEFKQFEEAYIPGRHIVIGDLALFNKQMITRLLKFVEDNPDIDCYSSQDICNPILLSRFPFIFKEPLVLTESNDLNSFKESNRDFIAAQTLMSSCSFDIKLRLYKSPDSILKVLESL